MNNAQLSLIFLKIIILTPIYVPGKTWKNARPRVEVKFSVCNLFILYGIKTINNSERVHVNTTHNWIGKDIQKSVCGLYIHSVRYIYHFSFV